MGGFLTETMIYAGAALMVWNIYSYIQFSRNIRQSGSWETERTVLVIPTLLLILFLLFRQEADEEILIALGLLLIL